MTARDPRNMIRLALASLPDGHFPTAARHLLDVLGYRSDRTISGQSGNVADFLEHHPAPIIGTHSEQEFRNEDPEVHILFQVTDTEIDTPLSGQRPLFEIPDYDKGNSRSFLFVTVGLSRQGYSRSTYTQFTREINKRFSMPTVVLFRTNNGMLSISFVRRRPHKRDPERDVLGDVSLIREINSADPHRAHLEILKDLSIVDRLAWMESHAKPTNFDGLLDAWLTALDTDALNKRFYRELFDWFKLAVQEARFPTTERRTVDPEVHVIRLITRLLFVWFVKQQGLVADALFNEHQIRPLLSGYDRETGDSYYRTVLQNLFFATLNTEINRRGFSARIQVTHRNFSLYRHQAEMTDPDALCALFGQTPFINGGLFDCLDTEASTSDGGYRIDCFSDHPDHRDLLSIPNRLFFGLNGLIDLFDRYRFTVEENTPIDREVALDPELLGQVFENLLAAYNPETRATARKQTGSYYTPRPVVEYMVDEVLVKSLKQTAHPDDGDTEFWTERLRYLLDHADAFDDADELFTPEEKISIVRAIADIKVLDPAVGSGAFPMAVLHKLTLALRRLDSDNLLWESLQRELAINRARSAFETRDKDERDIELMDISNTFEKYRDSDFGRKLYLIQNSIFGVDIQPIACQIAKLRFFISLTIEQHSDVEANNLGIKPLPNLETRFVAADTLVGLRTQRGLTSHRTQQIEHEINANRQRHFHASTRNKKLAISHENKELRTELAVELRRIGIHDTDADQIAKWDPYDQNNHTNWFDMYYMFGVVDGFDIVIGNPPYLESRNRLFKAKSKDAYQSQVRQDWQAALPRGSDLLIYFFPRAALFLGAEGHGSLITQNGWLSTDYGKKFQEFSLDRFSIGQITDTSTKFFSDTSTQNINTVICDFTREKATTVDYVVLDENMSIGTRDRITAKHPMKWGHVFAMPKFFQDILSSVSDQETKNAHISIGQGLNLPKRQLDVLGADVPIVVEDPSFKTTEAKTLIDHAMVPARRWRRVPALIMPRGIGFRYYCSFNECRAFSFSFVELYLSEHLWHSDIHYGLWAYLNSSFVWCYREITGRKNLGGGLLKAEASDLKALPVGFSFSFAEEARKMLDRMGTREPLPVWDEVETEEHRLIDEMVGEELGFAGKEDLIRELLLTQVSFRRARSRT